MALPTLHITNGPGQRDLELAFVTRNLGATVQFTISDRNGEPIQVEMKIFNFEFVTCHGPNYKLGGHLLKVRSEDREKLPAFNFVFVTYNTEARRGTMGFSNAE